MKKNRYIVKIPWDSAVFGIDAYEITLVSDKILKLTDTMKGHFTVRINPLSSVKSLLYRHGFYYCGTLIEPYCFRGTFRYFTSPDARVGVSKREPVKALIKISHGAFSYDRFHQDFNIKPSLSDLRYDRWLRKLHKANTVFGLMFNDKCIGFFGYTGNKILLHAINNEYQGKGLAKYLWSTACAELFKKGHEQLVSSISASNLPVLNLYSSLGFKFRNPVEIYHRLLC